MIISNNHSKVRLMENTNQTFSKALNGRIVVCSFVYFCQQINHRYSVGQDSKCKTSLDPSEADLDHRCEAAPERGSDVLAYLI